MQRHPLAAVLSALLLAALGWAALVPIRVASHEATFEIPRGTYAHRTHGDHVNIFPQTIRLTLGLKDVRLALIAGEARGVPLPFASVVRDNLVDAIGHGDAEKDWSALALVARRRAGLGR